METINFQVSHDNTAFNMKVLINNLNKYGILFPRNVLSFDSLELMKKVKIREKYEPLKKLSLKACLEHFYMIKPGQKIQHSALKDAEYCRRICEQGAKELGYGSLKNYFDMKSPLHYKVGEN